MFKRLLPLAIIPVLILTYPLGMAHGLGEAGEDHARRGRHFHTESLPFLPVDHDHQHEQDHDHDAIPLPELVSGSDNCTLVSSVTHLELAALAPMADEAAGLDRAPPSTASIPVLPLSRLPLYLTTLTLRL
jgi:hypothetical protein